MTRVALPERRAKLLDEVVDYILSNGLAGLSLRPLAAGVNTSPRMLLYFFGSKAQLISEALARIRLRQSADFVRAMSGRGGREERLLSVWSAWSSPRTGQFWRFCFGVYGLALQDPRQYAVFLRRFIGEWVAPLEQALCAAGFPRQRARSLATLALAAMRGLQLDLLATGGRARVNAAFREMLSLLTLAARNDPNAAAKGAHRKIPGNRKILGDRKILGRRKILRTTAAIRLEKNDRETIVGRPAGPKRRRA